MSIQFVIFFFLFLCAFLVFAGAIIYSSIELNVYGVAAIIVVLTAVVILSFSVFLREQLLFPISMLNMEKAQFICKDFGGIEQFNRFTFKCKNGLKFEAKDIKLNEQPEGTQNDSR